MQGLPAGSAGLISRLAGGGNVSSPGVLALPTAIREAATPLVYLDLEQSASRCQAIGTVRQAALFEGGVFGWDFPDVSAVWADIVALWKQFQRYHVNVRLAAVQTHPERSRQCGRIYVPGAKLDLRVTG